MLHWNKESTIMASPIFPVRNYFLLNINLVIRLLIISDVIWNGAIGLLGPIFAIFVVDFIEGANVAVVGVATTVFLITKSLVQIPAATIIDRIRGEKDDYWILFISSLVVAFIPLLYLIIHTPLHLYLVQFLYGIAMAFTFPSYMAIFTRHIDRDKEGTEWGIYFTLTDLSAAVAATIGGVMAETIGFRALIIAVVIIRIISALILQPIRYRLYPVSKRQQTMPAETSH